MKKNILYFSLPALIMWAASNVCASSCKEDFHKMSIVIMRDNTLSSKNGIRINRLFGPVTSRSAESCGAGGESPWAHHCVNFYRLSWKRGNWKSTLIAVKG